jgi:hypothetical protein
VGILSVIGLAEGGNTMFPVLDLVDELKRMNLADASAIGKRIGVQLQLSAAESNQYFRVLRGAQSASYTEVSRVEMRVPIDPTQTTSKGLVLLSIDANRQCITSRDVEARYGPNHGLVVPTPHQPSGSPIAYTYAYTGGETRFGISQGPRDCLVSVLVERRE